MRKRSTNHNIICLECEWLYSKNQPRENKFNLNSAPLLEWLQEFYNCKVIYRKVLNRSSLQHYMDCFARTQPKFKKYDVVYLATHGGHHAISLEGEDGNIDLEELVEMNKDFFKERIVHFSACHTMSNEDRVFRFKDNTQAKLVCGYTKSVDAMKSAIADVALFNELLNLKNVGVLTNKEKSKFWKTYGQLLDDLGFRCI